MLKQEEVNELRNAKTEKEWDSICDRIKAEHGGQYPSDWFMKILASGVASEAASNWRR